MKTLYELREAFERADKALNKAGGRYVKVGDALDKAEERRDKAKASLDDAVKANK